MKIIIEIEFKDLDGEDLEKVIQSASKLKQ